VDNSVQTAAGRLTPTSAHSLFLDRWELKLKTIRT
jgi:hypothetical protein